MAWLTRHQISSIVEAALREVADFSGAAAGFQIAELTDQHKVVFMNAIPPRLEAQGFRVTLTLAILSGCETVGGLIDYIEEHQAKLA